MSVWIKKVKICFLTSKRLIGGTLQWAHMLAEAQDAPALSITQVCTSLCKSRHPAPAAHSSAAVPAAGYSQLTTKRLIAPPFPSSPLCKFSWEPTDTRHRMCGLGLGGEGGRSASFSLSGRGAASLDEIEHLLTASLEGYCVSGSAPCRPGPHRPQ